MTRALESARNRFSEKALEEASAKLLGGDTKGFLHDLRSAEKVLGELASVESPVIRSNNPRVKRKALQKIHPNLV